MFILWLWLWTKECRSYLVEHKKQMKCLPQRQQKLMNYVFFVDDKSNLRYFPIYWYFICWFFKIHCNRLFIHLFSNFGCFSRNSFFNHWNLVFHVKWAYEAKFKVRTKWLSVFLWSVSYGNLLSLFFSLWFYLSHVKQNLNAFYSLRVYIH